MAAFKLALVDEDFVQPDLPADAPKEVRTDAASKSMQAKLVREGRRREREKWENTLPAVATAHAAEVARLRDEWSEHAHHRARASFWQAFAMGGALFAVLGACGAVTVMSLSQFGLTANVRAMSQSEQPAVVSEPLVHSAAPYVAPCDMALLQPGHHCPVQPASAP